MGERVIRVSDLSGELIEDEAELVRLIVRKHPALSGGPVEVEALDSEVAALAERNVDVVTLDVVLGDGSEPRPIVLRREDFDRLATERPMSDVLGEAKSAFGPRRTAGRAGGRPDYGTLAHAGTPHRGKITEAEQSLVRDNLDAVNERLAAGGVRTIDLADPEMASRYGFPTPAG